MGDLSHRSTNSTKCRSGRYPATKGRCYGNHFL